MKHPAFEPKTTPKRRSTALLLLASVGLASLAAAENAAWAERDLPTWAAPVADGAIVTEGITDIRWVPEDYVFAPGPDIRYIDYAGGDDAADGSSKATAWKHHPWDLAATGQAAAASGSLSYVFKGGVIYRGSLVADESGSASARIDDGAWHHVLVEVDRDAGRIMIYVDGQDVSGDRSGDLPAASVSLDNDSDFVVGEGLVGTLDYLRVARGTLADALTDIDELMSFQFNGPALHDFAGRAPTGGVRDAGALEHESVSGRQEIRYTPPAVEAVAEEPAVADGGVVFKEGPDRNLTVYDWGTVSTPKTVAPGEWIDFQVVFGTETVAKQQILVLDLHGWKNGKRVPGAGRSGHKPKVVPGVTTPYEAAIKMPALDKGFQEVTVVFSLSPDGKWSNKTLSGSVKVGYPQAEAE
jgi:hypothetical protein